MPATRNLGVFCLVAHGCGSGRGNATMIAAATGDPHPIRHGLILAAAAVIAVAVWVWKVYRHPYMNCRRCGGPGRKYQNSKRKAWGDCRKCGGSGRRLRPARVIWTWTQQNKRKATK